MTHNPMCRYWTDWHGIVQDCDCDFIDTVVAHTLDAARAAVEASLSSDGWEPITSFGHGIVEGHKDALAAIEALRGGSTAPSPMTTGFWDGSPV